VTEPVSEGPGAPTVLCVDDDEEILEFMKAMLGPQGFRVMTASSGRQALDAVPATRPDVVLLDVKMPDLTGYEVCAKLQEKQETAYIPVIMVTALAGERDQLRALRAGAADYLVKPIVAETLLEKVRSHLGTRGRWAQLGRAPSPAPAEERWDTRFRASEFARFKDSLASKLRLPPDARAALARATPPELYAVASGSGIAPRAVAQAVAELLGLGYVASVEPGAVRLGVFPAAFSKSNHVVALAEKAAFALSNPFHWEAREAIRRTLERGQAPKLLITEPGNVEDLLSPKTAVTARRKTSISEIEAQVREEFGAEQYLAPIADGANEKSAPIIDLVNRLIEEAVLQGASDLHLEPGEEEVVVRYRVDGDLAVKHRLRPARIIQPMVARLKIMASLDIAERRLPQDGRIQFRQYSPSGQDVDLRVAVAPQNFGEKVVLRVIDKQKTVLPLESLGFSPRNLKVYRERVASPYGMILHVGPTGSGKSMSLYAALNEVRNETINIQTAEDPIEYTLPGINQLQVKAEIGLTFQAALRSFLRLDPDVILVGEIRDHETAQMAVDASLTGHLLLSTLHTNDAASTVMRLIEMGIEPYMISSSLLMVCAQRLLRRLCPACKEPHRPDEAQRRLVGACADEDVTLFRARGCERCGRSGYKGRVGVHEILVPDDALRVAMTRPGVTSEALKRMAVEAGGMTTLYWDAMEKVRSGLCSLEDALGNVRRDEFDSRPSWLRERRPEAVPALS
jgi:type IV pilus assembly protein PilB